MTSRHLGGEAVRLHGDVETGYEPVADVFLENFRSRGDLGSACAVYVGPRRVVDVWAGVADARSGRPWDAETAAVIFSCSKGVVAICAYLLVQQGRLDLDAPVVTYWPEFGARGKDRITSRQILAHRAGLPALDRDLTLDETLAWEPVIHAIEMQTPLWAPEAGHFYHAMTYGWLIGEVIRRITGLTPGAYVRRELAEPLGLRTWIGIPPSAHGSVAWMEPPLPDVDTEDARVNARIAAENPVLERSVTMGGAFAFPAQDGFVTFNDPRIQEAEIPAANGISTARSLAALYAQCVSDMDMPRLLRPASIEDATTVLSAGPPLSGLADDGARWGTGFQLASPPTQPMLGRASFGHAGAGGQLAFGDAEHAVGFAYLSNQMGGYGDERARQLTLALRSILGA